MGFELDDRGFAPGSTARVLTRRSRNTTFNEVTIPTTFGFGDIKDTGRGFFSLAYDAVTV